VWWWLWTSLSWGEDFFSGGQPFFPPCNRHPVRDLFFFSRVGESFRPASWRPHQARFLNRWAFSLGQTQTPPTPSFFFSLVKERKVVPLFRDPDQNLFRKEDLLPYVSRPFPCKRTLQFPLKGQGPLLLSLEERFLKADLMITLNDAVLSPSLDRRLFPWP